MHEGFLPAKLPETGHGAAAAMVVGITMRRTDHGSRDGDRQTNRIKFYPIRLSVSITDPRGERADDTQIQYRSIPNQEI